MTDTEALAQQPQSLLIPLPKCPSVSLADILTDNMSIPQPSHFCWNNGTVPPHAVPDRFLPAIRDYVQNGSLPEDPDEQDLVRKMAVPFVAHKGQLFLSPRRPTVKSSKIAERIRLSKLKEVIIDPERRTYLLQYYCYADRPAKRYIAAISRKNWWPRLSRDARLHLVQCDGCQRAPESWPPTRQCPQSLRVTEGATEPPTVVPSLPASPEEGESMDITTPVGNMAPMCEGVSLCARISQTPRLTLSGLNVSPSTIKPEPEPSQSFDTEPVTSPHVIKMEPHMFKIEPLTPPDTSRMEPWSPSQFINIEPLTPPYAIKQEPVTPGPSSDIPDLLDLPIIFSPDMKVEPVTPPTCATYEPSSTTNYFFAVQGNSVFLKTED